MLIPMAAVITAGDWRCYGWPHTGLRVVLNLCPRTCASQKKKSFCLCSGRVQFRVNEFIRYCVLFLHPTHVSLAISIGALCNELVFAVIACRGQLSLNVTCVFSECTTRVQGSDSKLCCNMRFIPIEQVFSTYILRQNQHRTCTRNHNITQVSHYLWRYPWLFLISHGARPNSVTKTNSKNWQFYNGDKIDDVLRIQTHEWKKERRISFRVLTYL